MINHHFDLVSHWRIAAPADRVWAALTAVPAWPHWWPGVLSVQTLRPGGAQGLGSVQRIEWATRLPHDLVIEIEVTESLPPERLRGRASGHLRGEGIWLLSEADHCTDVTYVWRVELAQPWMRWLTPLLAPLCRWNHGCVMRAGGAGLARYLGAASLESAPAVR